MIIILNEVKGGTIMACGCQSNGTIPLEVTNIIEHNDETVSFDFVSVLPMYWSEGNSSKLFLNINGDYVGKTFSYATLPDENVIRFTTRIRDNRSNYKNKMAKLSVGDIIDVSEPSGSFELKRDGRPALLLSNGVGIATMRSLIKSYEQNQNGIGSLTQVNVDRSGEIYKDEFLNIEGRQTQFTSVYTSNRNEFYDKVLFESQRLMFGTGMIPNIYIVGSDNFIIDTMSYLTTLGINTRDIYTDGQMNSGGCGCSSGPSTNTECGCGGGCSCA